MPERYLVTDCGSTTTKAILFEKGAGRWRMAFRAEAPTTVEKPFEDVTIGVRNAVDNLEEISGLSLKGTDRAVDVPGAARAYLSTSSAGGGLQMLVMGLVKTMTAQSAERAALGAGAIVMEAIAVDDGRKPHEKITLLRRLRPDIALIAGGTDGGDTTHVVEAAELLLAASPRPRFGSTLHLPVIYAGNQDVAAEVERLLKDSFDVLTVPNLRPRIDQENLHPTRAAIHEVFLRHVMSHAPGYSALLEWADQPIRPTPRAVGDMVELVAERRDMDVMAVDIGGATTDVFSVFSGRFTRTVSANLGMSYSVGNVLAEAGIENIVRWLPENMCPEEARHILRNKMLRPTTIPETLRDLYLEQAAAREALRLSLEHHRDLAVSLSGVAAERGIEEVFASGSETLVDMASLGLLIGSGGVLSHAPKREQAALMLLDAFQPEGFTRLAVDSVFMLPHLGVLSLVEKEGALEVLENDCLVPLGPSICPFGAFKPGRPCLSLRLEGRGGLSEKREIPWGGLLRIPLDTGEKASLSVEPVRGVDAGSGSGKTLEMEVEGGVVGLIVDARGRPVVLPRQPDERVELIARWHRDIGA